MNFKLISAELFEVKTLNASSFTKVTTKTVKLENKEDKEEYLNIKKTTIQVNIKSKLSCSDKANKMPRKVATPLPPLNFNQTGKTCPIKTIIHDK